MLFRSIPTPPPGVTPDLTGLRTGAGAKPKKETDVSERMYRLRLALNDSEIKGEDLKAIGLRFDIAALKYEESKLRTRQDALDLADAEKTKLQSYGDAAAQIGSDIVKDFLKRNQLQEDYKRTIEDLQIKAGMITGDKLKQVEIDREVATILERLPGLTQAQIDKIKELVTASKQVKDSFSDTFGESLKQYYDNLKNFGAQVADSVKGAFQGQIGRAHV